MKKVKVVLFICMLGLSLSTFAQTTGDVNEDGNINIIDALLIAQYYIGLDPPGFNPDVADVNFDSSIAITDSLLIAQYYVGIITEWPPVPTPTPEITPISTPTQPSGDTIVAQHGNLQVSGNQMLDQYGNVVILRGISSHWVLWYPQFINYDAIKWFIDNWHISLFRVALGIEPAGGYLSDPEWNKSKVIEAVDACIDLGIYIIIDWHDHNAENHQSQSIDFFREMATKYGNTPNVIYELYNEPTKISWPNAIKPYAEAVISNIRPIDPDNIIVVGTPQWSQLVSDAADNPISGTNIMYTLHYYAATHGQWLRDEGDYALNRGIALFVTEFGTCAATGDGAIDYAEANTWFEWMKARNISWAAWNLSDKDESSAFLYGGASTTGGWSESDFKPHAILVRDNIE